MRNPILLTAILLALTLSAKADPIPVSPELKSFLMRPEQQQAVNGMLAQQRRAFVGNCSTPHLQPTTVLIDNSPTFDQAGVLRPDDGGLGTMLRDAAKLAFSTSSFCLLQTERCGELRYYREQRLPMRVSNMMP
jgi:hypothetical protein